jgi:hypothetical protein
VIQTCRHCKSEQTLPFLDLGFAPPSNAYLMPAALHAPEMTFPLRLFACRDCRLVQTEDYSSADTFFAEDYAYFSSTSRSWLDHARRYSVEVIDRFGLDSGSHVMELASNDGYLLRNFVQAGVPCLGIEPTHSTAQAARKLGIDVVEAFFGETLAQTLPKSDLIIGNNVFAHVPDINDFSIGMAHSLKAQGVITLEFPHLMNLVGNNQFDTVYHEHFSYLSLHACERILGAAGLRVFDVDQLPTHGGSLRIYACHTGADHAETPRVAALRALEHARGMAQDSYYIGFQEVAETVKNDFLRFLLDAKAAGKSVAGYGAAAKGNTLMNFAGIRHDLVEFVCDAAPFKIGKLLPGSHIPILDPQVLQDLAPDYLVIFPWNIADEIIADYGWLADKGTQFVVAVPELKIL